MSTMILEGLYKSKLERVFSTSDRDGFVSSRNVCELTGQNYHNSKKAVKLHHDQMTMNPRTMQPLPEHAVEKGSVTKSHLQSTRRPALTGNSDSFFSGRHMFQWTLM